MKNISILSKLFFMLLSLCVIIIASYFTIWYFNNLQKNNGTMIDLAGRNRMLSQRIGVMILLSNDENEETAKNAKEYLLQTLILHDQSLQVLKNGGIPPELNVDIILTPSPDFIMPKLDEVIDFSKNHRLLVEKMLNEPKFITQNIQVDSLNKKTNTLITFYKNSQVPNQNYLKAYLELKGRIIKGTLLNYHLQLTNLYTQHSLRSYSNFILILGCLFVLSLVTVYLTYLLMRNAVLPIKDLTTNITQLAEGGLPPILSQKSNDEFGKMTLALNKLTENLITATAFAKAVGEENFDTEYVVFQNRGELSNALNKMKDNLKLNTLENLKRNWLNEGVTIISEISRTIQSQENYTKKVLSRLIEYILVEQGAIYEIRNGDSAEKSYLEMTACYAFNRQKFIKKSLLLGEGIAGQVFLERKPLYLKHVPKEYTIPSGLGEGYAQYLLEVPLQNKDEIVGVMELASYKPIEAHAIQLVEKVAEIIATDLINLSINEKTKSLLQVAQQQTEELRTQEEEMKQTMEELSTTQEEMHRKEKNYLETIAKLQTNHK